MIKTVFIVSNNGINHYYVQYASGYFRSFENVTAKIKNFIESAVSCEVTHHRGNVIEYEYK